MAYASSANPQTVSAKKPKYDTTDMECCMYTQAFRVKTTVLSLNVSARAGSAEHLGNAS